MPFRSEISVCRLSFSGAEVNDPGTLIRSNRPKAASPTQLFASLGTGWVLASNFSPAQLSLAVESTTQRLVLEMGLLSSMETTSPTLYWFVSSCAW